MRPAIEVDAETIADLRSGAARVIGAALDRVAVGEHVAVWVGVQVTSDAPEGALVMRTVHLRCTEEVGHFIGEGWSVYTRKE